MDIDGNQINICKNDEKIFNIHGSNLQFIASLTYSYNIQWEPRIYEKIKTRFDELMNQRRQI